MFDLNGHGIRYAGEPVEIIMDAVTDLFQAVAHDLGIDDPSSDAFIDCMRDRLSDASVPRKTISHLVEWCKCGCPSTRRR